MSPTGEARPAPRFPAFEKTSVGLQAAEAIKGLILSGDLGPGDVLPSERELAGMLGISRPSLREAIRVLSAMNVLESRHGGGTYVTSLDPVLLAQPINFLLKVDSLGMRHLFEVRRVLEVEAARIAAARIGEEALAEIETIVEEATAAIGDPERYAELDFALHTRVVEATENPIYLGLYNSVSEFSLESRRSTAKVQKVRRAAHQSHLRIVAALRAHDPDRAAEAMREHLLAVEAAVGPDKVAPRGKGRQPERKEDRAVPK